MRRNITFALIVLALAVQARAQDAPPSSPARLFEAGSYGAAAEQVQQRLEQGDVPAEDLYWAAQALLRAERRDEAMALLGRLGGEADDDPWRAIRQSAAALAGGDRQQALQQATRATELAPDSFFAHYQLGLARHEAQQWPQAAAAFSRAAEIDGQAAYAHYYAGVAYNRLKRIEPMATHFRRFLDLAPTAPERESVEQLLKLLRGLR